MRAYLHERGVPQAVQQLRLREEQRLGGAQHQPLRLAADAAQLPATLFPCTAMQTTSHMVGVGLHTWSGTALELATTQPTLTPGDTFLLNVYACTGQHVLAQAAILDTGQRTGV